MNLQHFHESIATDSASRYTMAKDTSEVLASYMRVLSNLIFVAERLFEREMAMIINILNRWITKKDISAPCYKSLTLLWHTMSKNFSKFMSTTYAYPSLTFR